MTLSKNRVPMVLYPRISETKKAGRFDTTSTSAPMRLFVLIRAHSWL